MRWALIKRRMGEWGKEKISAKINLIENNMKQIQQALIFSS